MEGTTLTSTPLGIETGRERGRGKGKGPVQKGPILQPEDSYGSRERTVQKSGLECSTYAYTRTYKHVLDNSPESIVARE